jgi:hypothetical protein
LCILYIYSIYTTVSEMPTTSNDKEEYIEKLHYHKKS